MSKNSCKISHPVQSITICVLSVDDLFVLFIVLVFCIVFLFILSLCSVPNVASVSDLIILDCSLVVL